MGMDDLEVGGLVVCREEGPLSCDVCGQLISPDGFCHHRRRFEYHVLILVLEGTLHITATGKAYAVQAGEYIFLRAGEEHFGHMPSRGRLSYLWVHVKGPAALETTNGGGAICFPEKGRPSRLLRVTERFRQLLEMSLEEPACPGAMMDCACRLLLMELSRACAADPAQKQSPAILAAMEWIRSHYHQPFTVAELAASVGYQPDYMSALFKRSTGASIVQYTNQLRLRMARALLTNYDITIKEAACSCGFPDEKYFMRLFKRAEGMTPTAFRKSQR